VPLADPRFVNHDWRAFSEDIGGSVKLVSDFYDWFSMTYGLSSKDVAEIEDYLHYAILQAKGKPFSWYHPKLLCILEKDL
jgi:hypothetical protein